MPGTLDIADGEQLQRWREGLRANRVALARHRHQGLQRLNTALAVVEKLRLIETELAGRACRRTCARHWPSPVAAPGPGPAEPMA